MCPAYRCSRYAMNFGNPWQSYCIKLPALSASLRSQVRLMHQQSLKLPLIKCKKSCMNTVSTFAQQANYQILPCKKISLHRCVVLYEASYSSLLCSHHCNNAMGLRNLSVPAVVLACLVTQEVGRPDEDVHCWYSASDAHEYSQLHTESHSTPVA